MFRLLFYRTRTSTYTTYSHTHNQDEEKKSTLNLSVWRKFVAYFRKLNTYHELVADGEATFSNANANGNPNEQ